MHVTLSAIFGSGTDTIVVAHMSGFVQSDILRALIHEVSALQEIIDTSTHRKAEYEGLIKTMTISVRTDGAFTSQHAPSAHVEEAQEEEYDDDVGTSGSLSPKI